MNILVTGGAGFIGSAFVRRAIHEGHNVANIDKLTYAGDLNNLNGCSGFPNYRFFHEDICSRSAILSIMENTRPEVIVHMAAETHVDRSIACIDQFLQTNVLGTQALLDSTLEYQQTHKSPLFMHISTDEVFGSIPKAGRFNEDSLYRPNSPYAASKASSDFFVKAYQNTYGLRTVTVNSSNNYGPRQFPEKLIPLTISKALNKQPIPVYGDGMQVRDWLYVEDHVDALVALIKSGKEGESYCIGANCERENLNVVKHICCLLSCMCDDGFSYENLIKHVKDRPGHDVRYATDASKLHAHTGWAPKIFFDEGLKKTVGWYMERFNTNQRLSH
ncbi:MAG: dTDP-glucose 4,6-dehydratase [Holosporales bacterium]|jgi:dTDP-glucose 4,6-dehydratase|nr:dTDP-glucose 4,6-dehydratase [Holosporales bacterium]